MFRNLLNHTSSTAAACTVLFAALALCTAPLQAVAPQPDEVINFQRGDLDGNGAVDAADYGLALAFAAGEARLEVIESIDVMDDGVIDENDLAAIALLAFGGTRYVFPPERIWFCRGDVTDDGRVNDADLRALKALLEDRYALAAPFDAADVNHDGSVDDNDVFALDALLQPGGGDGPLFRRHGGDQLDQVPVKDPVAMPPAPQPIDSRLSYRNRRVVDSPVNQETSTLETGGRVKVDPAQSIQTSTKRHRTAPPAGASDALGTPAPGDDATLGSSRGGTKRIPVGGGGDDLAG